MKKIVKIVAAAVFAVSLTGVVSAQYYAAPGYRYGYPSQAYPAGQAVIAPTPIYAHQGNYYGQPTSGDCQGGMCGVSYGGGCGDCGPCGAPAPLLGLFHSIWNGCNYWPGSGCSECVFDEMRKSWVSCPQCNVYGENLNAGPNSLGTGYRGCVLINHANPQPMPVQMVVSGNQTYPNVPGQQPIYHGQQPVYQTQQPMMTPSYPAPAKPGCSSCGGGMTVTMNAAPTMLPQAAAPMTYAPQMQQVSYQIQQQPVAQPVMQPMQVQQMPIQPQPVIIQQPQQQPMNGNVIPVYYSPVQQQPTAPANGASRRVNRHTSYYPPTVGGEAAGEAIQPTASQAQQAVFAVSQPKAPAYIRAQQNAKAQLGQPTFVAETPAETVPVQQFQAFPSAPAQAAWVPVNQPVQPAPVQVMSTQPVQVMPISQPVVMPQTQQIPQATQIIHQPQPQPQYIKIVPAAASQSVLAQPPMMAAEIPAEQIVMQEGSVMPMEQIPMGQMSCEVPCEMDCCPPCEEFRAPCLLPGLVKTLGCIFSRKPACNNMIPMGNAQLHTMPSYVRTVSGASQMQTLYTPQTCNRGLFTSMADGAPFNGFFAMRSCCGCASACGGGCGGEYGTMELDLDHDTDLQQMGLDNLSANRHGSAISPTSPYGKPQTTQRTGRTDSLLTLSTQRLRLDDGTEVVLEHDQTRAQRLAEQENAAAPTLKQVSHPQTLPAPAPKAPVESAYPIVAAEQPQIHLAPGEVLVSEQDFVIHPPENAPQAAPVAPAPKPEVTTVSYEEEIHVSEKPVLKPLGDNAGNPRSGWMLKSATPMGR